MSCCVGGGYCARVDTLFNLAGVQVLDVAWREAQGKLPAGLRLIVETDSIELGCPACRVIGEARGRRLRRLHDIPAFGAPVENSKQNHAGFAEYEVEWLFLPHVLL